MKNLLQAGAIAALFLLPACREGHNNPHHQHDASGTGQQAKAAFQCPMKCEGEKTYDKPGTCPVCKMDLQELK